MTASLISEWVSSLARWAADTSLSVILPAIVVLCISGLRLIPARWSMLLCGLVMLKLVAPIAVPVGWRAAFEPGMPAHDMAAAPISAETEAFFALDSDPVEGGVAGALPDTASAIDLSSLLGWLPWLWAAGSLITLFWLVLSQLHLRGIATAGMPANTRLRELLDECCVKAGINRRPPLLMVRGLESVAVFGVLRPLLLAPRDLPARHDEEEIRGILLHELQHLRRNDALWNWLALGACAIHWFNPLAWLMYRRLSADRELACDEAAVNTLPPSARRSYGEALLKTAERFSGPPPAMAPCFLPRKSELKHRLHLIMKPQPTSILARLATLVLGAGIAAFTFTTAARADGEREKSSSAEQQRERGESAESKALRDGQTEKRGPRDGELKKEGPRDGDQARSGLRDGEGVKNGPRDGEGARKEGARDGDEVRKAPREGEGDGSKTAERESDGERKKTSAGGDGAKKPAREGEGDAPRKKLPAEGDGDAPRKKMPAEGDGDAPRKKMPAEGDGDAPRKKLPAEGDGDAPRKKMPAEGDGARKKMPAEGGPESSFVNKPKTPMAQSMVLLLDVDGNVINSEGRVIPLDEVRSKLNAIITKNPAQAFTIRADKGAPAAKVIEVMQAVQDAGVKTVSFGAVN